MAKIAITAERREATGTGASRRLRRAGQVPAILYGADQPPERLSLEQNMIYAQLQHEAFHASIIDVDIGGQKQQAVLRDYQMHAWKPKVQHVDLQRVSATEKIHMKVPLHFLNQETAPGVRLQGGMVMHALTEVDVTCLPSLLPEYIAVDMGGLNLNQSVHLKDLKLPEGVVITSLLHGGVDQTVASITAMRAGEEEVAAEGVAVPAPAPAEKK